PRREIIGGLGRRVLLELGQVVGDLEPRRLGADEDVLRRPHAGLVDERAERDVNVLAVPHDRIEERAARRATRVVELLLTVDEQGVVTGKQLELLALDPGERLERRPGGGAAT